MYELTYGSHTNVMAVKKVPFPSSPETIFSIATVGHQLGWGDFTLPQEQLQKCRRNTSWGPAIFQGAHTIWQNEGQPPGRQGQAGSSFSSKTSGTFFSGSAEGKLCASVLSVAWRRQKSDLRFQELAVR